MNAAGRIVFRFYRGCRELSCADRASYLRLQREQPDEERENELILRWQVWI